MIFCNVSIHTRHPCFKKNKRKKPKKTPSTMHFKAQTNYFGVRGSQHAISSDRPEHHTCDLRSGFLCWLAWPYQVLGSGWEIRWGQRVPHQLLTLTRWRRGVHGKPVAEMLREHCVGEPTAAPPTPPQMPHFLPRPLLRLSLIGTPAPQDKHSMTSHAFLQSCPKLT